LPVTTDSRTGHTTSADFLYLGSSSEIAKETSNQMAKEEKVSAEQTVRDIRCQARRKYTVEEKIQIALEGLRGEASVAELCRREGINPHVYYRWSKEFLKAGKARLMGDTKREANSSEVDEMRRENEQLKQVATLLYNTQNNHHGSWLGTAPTMKAIMLISIPPFSANGELKGSFLHNCIPEFPLK
jgi:transposase